MAKKISLDDGLVLRDNQNRLPKLLKYIYAGNAERKGMLAKEAFKKSLEGVTCFVKDNQIFSQDLHQMKGKEI